MRESIRMRDRSYKMRHYSAALAVLFAAFIAFVPSELLCPANIETSNQFFTAPIFAAALPSVPTVMASRAQRAWVLEAAKQNAHYAAAGNLAVPPGIESYTFGSEPGLIHRFQPHTSLSDCDRAPPLPPLPTFTTIS